jgi:hypothetical protein
MGKLLLSQSSVELKLYSLIAAIGCQRVNSSQESADPTSKNWERVFLRILIQRLVLDRRTLYELRNMADESYPILNVGSD